MTATVTCCLGPEAVGSVLYDLARTARRRLGVAVYECSLYHAHAFPEASAAGARVSVLLDAHGPTNVTTAHRLARWGIPCRAIGGSVGAEAHWKLLLADAAVAVGSGNLLRRDAPRTPLPPHRRDAIAGTREWWVVVEGAPTVLRTAAVAFDAAWEEGRPASAVWPEAAAPPPVAPPIGVPPRLVAPRRFSVSSRALDVGIGGATVASLLADALAGARRRAWCIVPYVHPHVAVVADLLDAMAAAAARGCDARLLLGLPAPPADVWPVLRQRHLPVRVMDPARVTTGHAKGLVVDDRVVVGSANWSASGLGGNREAALAVRSRAVADWFAAAFRRDWEAATAPALAE